MIQTVFLVCLSIGIFALIAAIVFARLKWRPDIEPYGRRTRLFNLAVNLNDYILPHAVTKVRLLGITGIAFLVIAIGALACKFIQDFACR
jgi:hypothetical protein